MALRSIRCLSASIISAFGVLRPKHAALISDKLIGFEAARIFSKQALLSADSILLIQSEGANE
jgi:hypothetical protein